MDIHLTQVTPFCSVRLHGLDDYPRTLAEVESRFSTELTCGEYLWRLRWPRGFRCVRCGEAKTYPLRSGPWQCLHCAHQLSATAGTAFRPCPQTLPSSESSGSDLHASNGHTQTSAGSDVAR